MSHTHVEQLKNEASDQIIPLLTKVSQIELVSFLFILFKENPFFHCSNIYLF